MSPKGCFSDTQLDSYPLASWRYEEFFSPAVIWVLLAYNHFYLTITQTTLYPDNQLTFITGIWGPEKLRPLPKFPALAR